MGLIAIEDMQFYAFHGYYKEEQTLGQLYSVDVYLHTDFKAAANSDDLRKTVNYETVYEIVSKRMKEKTHLLETIAEAVARDLKSSFSELGKIRVRINKPSPPLGGHVGRTFVEVEYEHRKQCGKCGKEYLCYLDNLCWCQSVKVSKETREILSSQFVGCLCKECLSIYSE